MNNKRAKRRYGKKAEVIWNDKKRYLGMPISFTRYYLIRNGEDWFKAFIDVGLFNTRIDEVNLYRMYDVALKQSFWDKIFGTGTVIIYTSDATVPQLVLKNVKNPFYVRDIFSKNIEEQRKANGVRVAEFQTK